MDVITYKSTLKASGKEYSRIVFWNRFIRNPIELILTWIPAALSIVAIVMGYFTTFLSVIYAACWCYPLYIFLIQFKSGVNYHLKNRDAAESAPCMVTISEVGIVADIADHDQTHTYEWDQFTTVYDKFGYYMFFNKGKMIVMLRKADMSDAQRAEAPNLIKKFINMNECKVLF